MKRRVLWAALIMVGGFSATAWSDITDDFPSGIHLRGNSKYNYGQALSDWDVNVDQSGTIAMGPDGLAYTPLKGDGNSVRHQLKPAFTVEDGVAWAKFRIAVHDAEGTDTQDIGFVMGLHVTDSDPFTGDLPVGAYFRKDTGTDQVKIHVREDNSNYTEANGPTIEDDTAYQFVVKVEDNGSYAKVKFWWRECGCAFWTSSSEYTTNTPASSEVLRYSVGVKTIDEDETDFVTIDVFEFEADR